MALSTYANLLASVAAWLNRDDLTAVIPDFVTLAEADMNSRLRLRAMLTRATATLDEAYETLPTDYLHMYRVVVNDDQITFAPSDRLARYALDYAGEAPKYYAITGSQLQLVPTPTALATATIEMTYYARPSALSDSNPSNAILAASPGIYLYGALIQAAPYLGDDQRTQTWGQLYQDAIKLLQDADDAAEFPAPLVIHSSSWDMAP
jgi:hypothetical protein